MLLILLRMPHKLQQAFLYVTCTLLDSPFLFNHSFKSNIIVLLQEELLKEFTEEIRKLKAVIVKHEGRIRVLESAVALQMKEDERKEKSSSPTDREVLASDEV